MGLGIIVKKENYPIKKFDFIQSLLTQLPPNGWLALVGCLDLRYENDYASFWGDRISMGKCGVVNYEYL